MIDGYIKWLQTALGNKYLVCNEEKTDVDADINTVILSEYEGHNYSSCIMLNYQAMVLTNDIPKTMKELQEFTFIHNDERISTEEFPYVRNLMQQPVNVSNYEQYSSEYMGTITISISLMCSISINDIKSITIDGEPIDPTQMTITYQTVPDTNRVNSSEINSTDINEASLMLQITYPMDYSEFFNKIRNIMFGVIAKNSPFEVNIAFTDNVSFDIVMKMSSRSISFDKQALTVDSVTLIH